MICLLVIVATGYGLVVDDAYRLVSDLTRQTWRAQGGSGIDLAIAKALVEAHGGQLTVTSPGTGQGSTFRILLPRG